jgi:hypothetical protein
MRRGGDGESSLRMKHSLDEENIARSSSARQSIIDELFRRLMALSTQLESVIELSSSLRAQHAVAHKVPSLSLNSVSSHSLNNPKYLSHP